VVPVVRQGVLDWLANDQRAFSHAEEVAERTAEQLPGDTMEAVAGEAKVELAIRDARRREEVGPKSVSSARRQPIRRVGRRERRGDDDPSRAEAKLIRPSARKEAVLGPPRAGGQGRRAREHRFVARQPLAAVESLGSAARQRASAAVRSHSVSRAVMVYAVVDDSLSATSPLGDAIETSCAARTSSARRGGTRAPDPLGD
jgi:hypothetical protein